MAVVRKSGPRAPRNSALCYGKQNKAAREQRQSWDFNPAPVPLCFILRNRSSGNPLLFQESGRSYFSLQVVLPLKREKHMFLSQKQGQNPFHCFFTELLGKSLTLPGPVFSTIKQGGQIENGACATYKTPSLPSSSFLPSPHI